MAAVPCETSVKRRVHDAEAASVQEEAHHHCSRADEVPTIFLSHSGKQKGFVEHLYNALQSANHTAFFDKHTIPKGSSFACHIERAAHGCTLGVVVLSEDFLTSKWPMLELEIFLQRNRPDASVLPLFYNLSPEDLKSEENLAKWRHIWQEKAAQWEKAIKDLSHIVGEVFTPRTSEVDYIKRVVRAICNLVPSPISNDLSLIQGYQRITQEVASQFKEEAVRQRARFEEEAARQRDGVYCMLEEAAARPPCCMVGLYGVGGLGKTTVCKMMCNFYMSEYLGKTCLIEFPSDGKDKKVIVQECKKALKKLANLSDEHVLNIAHSFDEVVQLMKENLGRYDVFLAIDNVWESSLEEAKRMLGVSFSANSKVLLTSRSEAVLKDLVSDQDLGIVRPLPSPDQDEAFQVFQKTSELDDLKSSVSRNLLHRALNTCHFSGQYHALALKALGQHVKKACKQCKDPIKVEDTLSDILQGIDQQNVIEDLIRLNYDNLAAEKQHMFLDIVVVVMHDASRQNYGKLTYEQAHLWLSILYKSSNSAAIHKHIYDLALDGLIQLENIDDKNAGKLITVHDLHSDLAQKEAAKTARFFTDRSVKSVKKIEWEKLERVILRASDHRSSHFIKELHQQQCPNLAVLCVEKLGRMPANEIHLDRMPSLCVLKLERGHLRSIKNWSAATGLAIVHLERMSGLSKLAGLSGLTSLESRLSLCFNGSMKVVVGGLSPALKDVKVYYCDALKRMPDLSGLACLERLDLHGNESMEVVGGLSPALKDVKVWDCGALKRMPDIRGLTCLERLLLRDNKLMEEVVGGLSPALKDVEVSRCGALKRMPDLSCLTCLERLLLRDNKSMEEVVGGLSPALKDVEVARCGALKRTPDLSGLTCLERLRLCDNASMEEVVGGLSRALKHVEVSGCGALKRMPDLSGLTCLERLDLCDIESMEEVVGGLSRALKDLKVSRCGALKRMPDLRGLTCLERLWLYDNKSMEEVLGLGLSPALKDVKVSRCGALKRMPDLSGLTCLERLLLRDNKSMEVVGGLSPALKHVEVSRCGALKRMSDLSGLTCLERLELCDNKSMEEVVGGLSPALKDVEVSGCGALKRMPDLSGLNCLETLRLCHNESMEEVVGDLSPALKDVRVMGCGALKRMPDLSGLTCLERLDLWHNESMEEVVGGLSCALKDVKVWGCGALKRMPDLSGLICLGWLDLCCNESMEEVVGGLSPALRDVRVSRCGALKRLPDLRGLTCLERLWLHDNKSMEEVVGGLSPALKDVMVSRCGALKRMPDLSGLTCLERLRLCGNGSMEEVGGENLSSTLEHLSISGCSRLRRFPSISGCSKLKSTSKASPSN